jgi:hypothetical protein
MNMNKSTLLIIIVSVISLPLLADGADDLNDGIEIDEYIDDAVQTDISRSFLKLSAMSATGIKGSKTIVMSGRSQGSGDGVGNINIEAGTDLRGATIINLSENNGVVVSQ